jgi:excisionase family DNA binding protein
VLLARLGSKSSEPDQTVAEQLRLDVSRPSVSLAEPLLTAAAAAELLSVRTSWVYDAARSGELPCVRLGKHLRFLRSDLERWVAEQRGQRPGRRAGSPGTGTGSSPKARSANPASPAGSGA